MGFVFLLFLSLGVLVSFVDCNNYPTCICTCCVPRSGVCLSKTEGNFTVDSCQQECTEEDCRSRFALCRAPGSDIRTSCSNAVKPFDTILISLSLLLIGLLTILSLLQYKSKVVRAVFPIQVAKLDDRGTKEHLQKTLIRNELLLERIKSTDELEEPFFPS